MHYLDTSVLMAFYFPEPRSAGVQRLLVGMAGPAISQLVEIELCSVIARKVRIGELERPVAARLVAAFKSHVAEPRFQLVPIGTAAYDLARDWIVQLTSPLRVLDALHMAVAQTNDLALVTADKQLAAVAKHFGVACRLIA